MMLLTVSGVVCGEGLRKNLNADSRTQKGGSWGLGGLGGSTGLLNRSLKYNSDMARTGIGSRAQSSSSRSSGGYGGYDRSYSGSSTSRNNYLSGGRDWSPTSTTTGAKSTTYTPKTIGDLKKTDLGVYKPGSGYSDMMRSLDNDLKPDVGKYKINPVGDVTWDQKDTLESQLQGRKKYGMKVDTSIARSDAYTQALDASGFLQDEKTDEEESSKITTLVPKNGGEFAELIRRGEVAFSKELYQDAISYFKLARRLSPRSPEVLLSLFHSSFAASSGLSYSLPAYYLQLSLKYFPELPLVDVHPKYFYGREGDFVRDQVRLEHYLESQPRDPNALFVMGYIQWRNDNPEQACKYLQNAHDLTKDTDMTEAISIIWDGMVASGKVKEKLRVSNKGGDETSPEAPAGK